MNTEIKTTVSRGASSQKNSQTALIGYTVVALGLALFIRFFVAAPYVVSGASMEPNFDNWHYLIIERVSYEVGEPRYPTIKGIMGAKKKEPLVWKPSDIGLEAPDVGAAGVVERRVHAR
ncbi:MAG: Signal peptidase I, partial [Candidatus Kaiserbacteria bacterium GW2011_GWA2_58_9]